MRRVLAAFLGLALLALPASAGELKIRWHGQSMFEIITPEKTRIVTDPHNLDAYGRKMLKADLVLMSHFHTDHTRTEVIENIKEAKALNALKKDADGRREDFNVVDEKFKDVRIMTVGTYHDDAGGLNRGKNGVWIIEVDGLRIAHLGDLGHMLNAAQLKKIGAVDVVMVPVGGVYTLNGLTAAKVVDQLKPKRWVLPMHYGTVVYDDLLPLKYFTDEEKEKEVEIKVFKPNEWLTIDTKAAAPKKYSVGVLHW